MARSFFPPAQVAKVAKLLDGGARPDSYRLLGLGAKVRDGRGGWTQPEQAIEAGTCKLSAAGTNEGERAVLGRLGWSSGYVVTLPLGTHVEPTHTIEINGRRMEIGEVETGGGWALGVRAYVQERGG